VVAGTIIPFNTATPEQNRRMRQINAWILSRPDRDTNLAVADTRRAVASSDDPDRLDGSPDGLHPSADGYRRMADAIRSVLEGIVAG